MRTYINPLSSIVLLPDKFNSLKDFNCSIPKLEIRLLSDKSRKVRLVQSRTLRLVIILLSFKPKFNKKEIKENKIRNDSKKKAMIQLILK